MKSCKAVFEWCLPYLRVNKIDKVPPPRAWQSCTVQTDADRSDDPDKQVLKIAEIKLCVQTEKAQR